MITPPEAMPGGARPSKELEAALPRRANPMNATSTRRLFPFIASLALAACESKSNLPPAPAVSAAPEAPLASAAAPSASAGASAAPLPSDDPSPAPSASAAASAATSKGASAAASAAANAEAKPAKERDAGVDASAVSASTTAKSPDARAASADAGPTSADAGAAPLSPAAAVAQKVDAIFLGKKAFTARFKQQYTQKISGKVKDSAGTLFVEKPNKISFRYDPPNKNRIVSDGKTLKIYVAEDNQMFETSVDKTEYPGALAFLMGNGISPSFNFTLNDKAKFDGGSVLLGKPREPTPSYEYVLFYVDSAMLEKADPGVMRRVLIVDAQGNKNRFDFEGAAQPASVDPAEFTFTPPPGTNMTR